VGSIKPISFSENDSKCFRIFSHLSKFLSNLAQESIFFYQTLNNSPTHHPTFGKFYQIWKFIWANDGLFSHFRELVSDKVKVKTYLIERRNLKLIERKLSKLIHSANFAKCLISLWMKRFKIQSFQIASFSIPPIFSSQIQTNCCRKQTPKLSIWD